MIKKNWNSNFFNHMYSSHFYNYYRTYNQYLLEVATNATHKRTYNKLSLE